MKSPNWSDEHKQLLFSDKTNEEIMAITGRTMKAVRSARYNRTGFYTEDRRPKGDERKKHRSEARIISMCKRIGVRIEGVHR